MSADVLKIISPVDGKVYAERPRLNAEELRQSIGRSRSAGDAWARTTIPERVAVVGAFVDSLMSKADILGEELTWQMGRPIRDSAGELRGLAERARYMMGIAEGALADIELPQKAGFRRLIQRVPHGVVLTVAPWNYPYLTAVNSVVPALLAGNSVILRHSEQTALCAERMGEAFSESGLPQHVFQYVHTSHENVAHMIESRGGVDYVAFTGSVAGGRAIERAAAARFLATGLELGGNDPAYVRSDVDLEAAVSSLVDGAFYNAGQSCCGIERIYVDQARYDEFVEAYTAQVGSYVLGDPTDANTTLGPLVRPAAARRVLEHADQAVLAGARQLIDVGGFSEHAPERGYLAPQVLVDVQHGMLVMDEESFGPIVGIMSVGGDHEAVRMMNDSVYGLTASVWTADEEAAMSLGRRVHTGTWFMNRCDYLDPGLAWTGVKYSGRGTTLSRIGFEQLTRPKSYHLRLGL
ncbi:MAG: aldehyde dehydrogenase family protein [Polyangiaceae bacterium]|nr:aldehyde dehydrogenase family protein [Polyangiaceae bacterium]